METVRWKTALYHSGFYILTLYFLCHLSNADAIQITKATSFSESVELVPTTLNEKHVSDIKPLQINGELENLDENQIRLTNTETKYPENDINLNTLSTQDTQKPTETDNQFSIALTEHRTNTERQDLTTRSSIASSANTTDPRVKPESEQTKAEGVLETTNTQDESINRKTDALNETPSTVNYSKDLFTTNHSTKPTNKATDDVSKGSLTHEAGEIQPTTTSVTAGSLTDLSTALPTTLRVFVPNTVNAQTPKMVNKPNPENNILREGFQPFFITFPSITDQTKISEQMDIETNGKRGSTYPETTQIGNTIGSKPQPPKKIRLPSFDQHTDPRETNMTDVPRIARERYSTDEINTFANKKTSHGSTSSKEEQRSNTLTETIFTMKQRARRSTNGDDKDADDIDQSTLPFPQRPSPERITQAPTAGSSPTNDDSASLISPLANSGSTSSTNPIKRHVAGQRTDNVQVDKIPSNENDEPTFRADEVLAVSLSGDGEALVVTWKYTVAGVEVGQLGEGADNYVNTPSSAHEGHDHHRLNPTRSLDGQDSGWIEIETPRPSNGSDAIDTSTESHVNGWVVSYHMTGRDGEDYDSSRLGSNVRSFVLHHLHPDEDYIICVHALAEGRRVKVACQRWSSSSLKVVIGVLAGTVFLLPCIIIMIMILIKDRKVRKSMVADDTAHGDGKLIMNWEKKHQCLARAYSTCEESQERNVLLLASNLHAHQHRNHATQKVMYHGKPNSQQHEQCSASSNINTACNKGCHNPLNQNQIPLNTENNTRDGNTIFGAHTGDVINPSADKLNACCHTRHLSLEPKHCHNTGATPFGNNTLPKRHNGQHEGQQHAAIEHNLSADPRSPLDGNPQHTTSHHNQPEADTNSKSDNSEAVIPLNFSDDDINAVLFPERNLFFTPSEAISQHSSPQRNQGSEQCAIVLQHQGETSPYTNKASNI